MTRSTFPPLSASFPRPSVSVPRALVVRRRRRTRTHAHVLRVTHRTAFAANNYVGDFSVAVHSSLSLSHTFISPPLHSLSSRFLSRFLPGPLPSRLVPSNEKEEAANWSRRLRGDSSDRHRASRVRSTRGSVPGTGPEQEQAPDVDTA